MTSGHPIAAYIFYLVGALLFFVKSVTWEDAKQQPVQVKRKIYCGVLGGLVLLTVLALWGTHKLNPNTPVGAYLTFHREASHVDARMAQLAATINVWYIQGPTIKSEAVVFSGIVISPRLNESCENKLFDFSKDNELYLHGVWNAVRVKGALPAGEDFTIDRPKIHGAI